MGVEGSTAKVRRVWDTFAPRYDSGMRFIEWVQFGGGREWVCSRARGEVLEVAVGTGRNLPLYPAEVSVTGVELSPAMLSQAKLRARDLTRPVSLAEGDAQALPFADESFDTVVCTLSMCAIPDDRAALAEMWRVLRPGGRLLLLDHIGSTWPPILAIQRLVEKRTIRSAGEYQTRRPRLIAEAIGFAIAEAERLKAGTVERLAAIKPAGAAASGGAPL
ncbi:MAG TPA: class I SAM-dependent methyltransferase [Micromonosporaceae bacterium]